MIDGARVDPPSRRIDATVSAQWVRNTAIPTATGTANTKPLSNSAYDHEQSDTKRQLLIDVSGGYW